MQDERMAEVVAAQHARIRELFHEAAHASVEHREQACARLVRFLAIHAAAEHEALHPRAPRWPDPVEEEILELAQGTERLEDLGPRASSYVVQLGRLAAVVDHHVRLGEGEVLPRFVATADDADVDRALDTLCSVVPLADEDGPGAVVPAEASFVGQLRAARDAVGGPHRRTTAARPDGRSRRDGPRGRHR